MRHAYTLAGLSLAALVLTACASTTFTETWKAPDAEPVGPMTGQKVVAFVLVKNQVNRRAAEDVLAGELTKLGALGVAGYTVVPDITDEAKAKALIEKSGVVGVVSMRPIARGHEKAYSPGSSGANVYTGVHHGPHYGPYWGGYYRYGWVNACPEREINVNTIFTVETLVYSLKQNKLLWAGQSRTTDPSKVEWFIKDVATAAAKQMKKDGVF